MSESSIRPQFARHETFAPRANWFPKAIREVSSGHCFDGEEAQVRLGVGKNMVTAIRYWAQAFRLIESAPEKSGSWVLSEFGKRVFDGKNALDPYFESNVTAWWLHWQLLQSAERATAWYFAFNVFRRIEFTADELENEINEYARTHFPTAIYARSSLRKDALAILRMYCARSGTKQSEEDIADSPFHPLGLILTTGQKGQYRFNIARKDTLPDAVVVAACLEFAQKHHLGSKSVSVNSLLYDSESPGRIFRIPESQIEDAIENCAQSVGVRLTEGAGSVRMLLPQKEQLPMLVAYGRAA